MEEFLITINDNKNNSNYVTFIDTVRPRDAKYAYICITKFLAMISIPSEVVNRCNNVVLNLNTSPISSFSNDLGSKNIVPSKIIDTFMSSTVLHEQNNHYAVYNYNAGIISWIKINISNLNNLVFQFLTSTMFINNNASYVDLPNFPFTLQFKIKFE